VKEKLALLRKDQQKYEKHLITNTSVCTIPELSDLEDKLNQVDFDSLSQVVDKQFYNTKVLETAMCISESIFFGNKYEGGLFDYTDRIRLYLDNLRQIGSESVYGYALWGDLKNPEPGALEAKNFFVIKVPRKDEDDNDLLHELVIGLFGTNMLRRYIPNFSYIYGGFRCSPPIIDPDTKEVTALCLNRENVINHIVYEAVNNAISAKNFVQSCSIESYLTMYLQLLYALAFAEDRIGFTHYDLHDENLLMRQISPKNELFQIPYPTEKGVEYILTTHIPTIIDYGQTRITYKEKSLGYYNFEKYGVIADQIWPLYDAYKFLIFSSKSAISFKREPKFITILSQIVYFFNDRESLVEIIKNQMREGYGYYIYPRVVSNTNVKIRDLIRYIRVKFANLLRPLIRKDPFPNRPFFECRTGSCLPVTDLNRTLGIMNRISVPRSIPEFYELYFRLTYFKLVEEKKELIRKFEYTTLIKDHYRICFDLLNKIGRACKTIKPINIKDLTLQEIVVTGNGILHSLRAMNSQFSRIIDESNRLRLYCSLGAHISTIYKNRDNNRKFIQLWNIFKKDYFPYIFEIYKDIILINRDKFKTLKRNKVKFDQFINANRDFSSFIDNQQMFNKSVTNDVINRLNT